MGNWITTYTGKHFDPVHPDASLIDIRDIAHALSLLCRGNGHVKTFYSVGQHCINCAKEASARGLSRRMVLACLLHDASECYLSDVPSPFKKTLEDYRQQEDHLLDLIYGKFLGSVLTEDEQAALSEIDSAQLSYDLEELLGEKQEELPHLSQKPDYTLRPFREVEAEYLEIFDQYEKKLDISTEA
jgi:5'-deoxynucleotidase YfbR-like HD superfamily hydrolase